MFNKVRKDSELYDLYGSEKAITEIPVRPQDCDADPFYKFKKNYNLSTAYEVYL